jgi:hypothetical protein
MMIPAHFSRPTPLNSPSSIRQWRRPFTDQQHPRNPDVASSTSRPVAGETNDCHRAVVAVSTGLVLAGVCAAVLNQFAGPIVDAAGLILVGGLYLVIGFAPHLD